MERRAGKRSGAYGGCGMWGAGAGCGCGMRVRYGTVRGEMDACTRSCGVVYGGGYVERAHRGAEFRCVLSVVCVINSLTSLFVTTAVCKSSLLLLCASIK